ncbi:MAG: periplasmic protein [Ignavibacteria bacterium]|nr:MAG: periplasmic protein [Ignavibacteria bacterium]KAF0158682.1 MAG: periplasmic protein [Ignavibacteria bacterium]
MKLSTTVVTALITLIWADTFSKNLEMKTSQEFNASLSLEIAYADNLTLPVFQAIGKFTQLSGTISQMNYFFEALNNARTHSVRIAHYGDSLILGDIITDYLREKFQQKFGGQGAGMLNIVSDDNRMRVTTIHTYSSDWTYYSFLTRNPNQLPLGISGALAIPKAGSWVKYETNSIYKSSSQFNIVKIYYSNADQNSTIHYSIDDGEKIKLVLEPGSSLNELVIKTKGNSKKFYMQFLSGASPSFYGVSLETSGNGVYIDNFPMRGNSGASLADIPEALLEQFNKKLHYDLIILSYGANVSSPNKGIFTVYEHKMVNVIKKYQKAFPNTSFLLISSSDRTQKVGSRFVTNPDVLMLIGAQKKIADKTGITFWNLSEMMGGKNSMNDWVNASPPLALKDYAHFTQLGGSKVAGFLYDAIMDTYSKYRK